MSGQIYKIGEAAQLLGLKSYVLRFWESEFPQLNPTRTESGQRLYSEQDIGLLRRIRHLLHERGLTIEGARKALGELSNADEGLSGELLDEGYQDFCLAADPEDGRDAEDPGLTAARQAARRAGRQLTLSTGLGGGDGGDPALAAALAEAAAKEAALHSVLDELKELRQLLAAPRNLNSQN